MPLVRELSMSHQLADAQLAVVPLWSASQSSLEKNLDALLPLVTDNTYKRCFFVVDDRNCSDLLREGDIDAVVLKATGLGLDRFHATHMATINTAEYFGLCNRGGIGPG